MSAKINVVFLRHDDDMDFFQDFPLDEPANFDIMSEKILELTE